MSRVAKKPVVIPSGVEVKIEGQQISVKGVKGTLQWHVHPFVRVQQNEKELQFVPQQGEESADALAGTTRALINNMVQGVSQGFEKKLVLVGVGYRAQMQGSKLVLALGFSHSVNYDAPEGIKILTPSQTEVVVQGVDKQRVGQVAAEIRGFRPPEPYKGKGVRYVDEKIVLKEAKKK